MAKSSKPAPKKTKYAFQPQKLAAAVIKKRSDEIIGQRKAAADIGMSQAGLYKVELGTSAISADYFARVCTWLEADPIIFLTK